MQPDIIKKLSQDLIIALEEDEKPWISIDRAAKLLQVDNKSLRVAIANGSCPFGFGGQHDRTGKSFGRISKLALYSWLAKGIDLKGEA